MRYVSFLIKPASSACNMRCRYCFYEDEAESRAVHNYGLMTDATAETLLREGFALADPGGAVSFLFQGGEPTLAGLGFFKRFTARAKELCPQGVTISFAIQTNGMVLDEAWADFFKEEDYLVGLSLDGFRELHDLYRRDAAGHDTFARTRRALGLLTRRGVRTNVLTVVTAQAAKRPDSLYNELKKLGARYMQFIPCLDPLGEARGGRPWSLTPEAYGAFLCRLFDLWYADWAKGDWHSVRLFEDHVNLLLGAGASSCAACGQCGSYFVVEADGGVYPCDFYAMDDWRMGTLGHETLADMAGGGTARRFLAWGAEKPAECASCRWRGLCNGGCKNDWTGHEGAPHNYYCDAFRRYFAHAEARLGEVARAEARARAGR